MTVSSHSGQGAEAEAFYTQVGRALQEWSQVEDYLFQIFCEVCGIRDGVKAAAVFGSIVAFDARLRVVDTLMRLELKGTEHLPVWSRLAARLAKFYKKRHELAHFSVMTKKTGMPDGTQKVRVEFQPFYSMASAMTGRNKTLSSSEIELRIRHFEELREAVWYFATVFIQKRTPQLGFRLREPDLIRQLRTLDAQTPEAPAPPPQS